MNNLSDTSKVWIYQSNRELTVEETTWLQNKLQAFAAEWTAHDIQLKAEAEVRYNRFIILMVDESQYGASGCSIDKSMRFMKEIEQTLNINLFDRFNIAYKSGNAVKSASRDEFENLLKNKALNAESIVFNNLISTKAELATNWETELRNSWHKQVFASSLQS